MSTTALLMVQDAVFIATFVGVVVLAFAGHRLAVPAGIVTVVLGTHAALSSAVVLGGLGPIGPDATLLALVMAQRSVAATTVMTVITDLGGAIAMILVAALTCVALLWQRRVRAALVMVVALGGAGLLVVGVKNLLARPRPPQTWHLVVETNYSFPSGHALSSLVVLGMVAAVVATGTTRTWVRSGVVIGGAGAVVLIGVSRLYLGVHWPSDVLDGWLLGAAWLAVCVAVLNHVEQRTTRPARHSASTPTMIHVRPGVGRR
jgi:undecaprenyl-diphosphatase